MIAGAEQRLFSMGTWYDGTPYFDPENTITLSVDAETVSESAGAGAVTGTITLANAAPAGGLDVTLESNGVMMHSDGSFSPDEIGLESLVVTVPAGATEVTFPIDIIDDGVLDGDQNVTIFARAGPYVLTGFTSFTVEDIAVSDLNVVINEMMSNVLETSTDYNLDGLTDDELGDQFVELVNNSGRLVNMSNWKLTWDTGGTFAVERLVHIFPKGTWVPDGGSIVVFGKISDQAAANEVFAGAIVQTARNRSGDVKKNGIDMRIDEDFDIKLFNEHGFLVDQIEEIAETAINQGMALTRSPDVTGELALHLEVSPSFQLASPGTRLDGTPFAGNGSIPIAKTFVNIETITPDGYTMDPKFGWFYVPDLSQMGQWVLVYNHSTWWYMYPFSTQHAMYIYDYDLGSWIFTSYFWYPWVYNYTTAEWAIR